MKEVSWCVCISSLLCNPIGSLSTLILWVVLEKNTEVGEPCIFLFGTMFHFCGNFPSFGMVYFLCCISPLSLPYFHKETGVEKAAWGTVLGVGRRAGACALSDRCGMYSAWWGGGCSIHVFIKVGLNPSQPSREFFVLRH